MNDNKIYRVVMIPILGVEHIFKIDNVEIVISNEVELKVHAKDLETVHDALDSLILSLRRFDYHSVARSVINEKGEHSLEISAVLKLPKKKIPKIPIQSEDIPEIERWLKTYYRRIHSGWKVDKEL